MFVLSLGKSLLMLPLLLLDFFATSPRIPAHCGFVYRFGSNCQLHLCLYFLPSLTRWNCFLRTRCAPRGWMLNPRGQWWSFEIGCFASHPWRKFPESILVFISLPIFLFRSPRQFTLKPGLKVSRLNVTVSQADHYYSLHSRMVLMLWLLISISISPRKTALTVSLSMMWISNNPLSPSPTGELLRNFFFLGKCFKDNCILFIYLFIFADLPPPTWHWAPWF